ncbi:hypothetical protein QBC33DRAFT_558707 [Phialemonium atrogriseum]|uniref:Uncharacterized protein n=1 Tax=Phialemonium atrogriseum TaxID=1093897 RepID=A0AAJ0C2G2_9PEZI|nr:uncharacterized protein QBC33DRAFT_558707 [Phialemonium atrogriseum]KAK1767883.1 hypothetical protein QBC33DRAFT_558707 [Phialemonium atrogriseum]
MAAMAGMAGHTKTPSRKDTPWHRWPILGPRSSHNNNTTNDDDDRRNHPDILETRRVFSGHEVIPRLRSPQRILLQPATRTLPATTTEPETPPISPRTTTTSNNNDTNPFPSPLTPAGPHPRFRQLNPSRVSATRHAQRKALTALAVACGVGVCSLVAGIAVLRSLEEGHHRSSGDGGSSVAVFVWVVVSAVGVTGVAVAQGILLFLFVRGGRRRSGRRLDEEEDGEGEEGEWVEMGSRGPRVESSVVRGSRTIAASSRSTVGGTVRPGNSSSSSSSSSRSEGIRADSASTAAAGPSMTTSISTSTLSSPLVTTWDTVDPDAADADQRVYQARAGSVVVTLRNVPSLEIIRGEVDRL